MRQMRIKPNSIKGKLITLIFITLVPLTILQAVNIANNYKLSVETELMSSKDYAEAYSSAFMNYLDNIWATQSAIGQSIILNAYWDKEDILHYMNKVIQSNVNISDFSWVDPGGQVIVSTNHLTKGQNLADRDYIQEIIAGKEKVLSNLRQSIDKKTLIIPIARGIWKDDRLSGIVVSTIKEEDLDIVVAAKREGETSSYGLIDKSGMIVYRFGSRNIPFERRKIKDDSPAWTALKGEIAWVNPYRSSIDGINRIGVSYLIKPIGWACFVTIAADEQLKPYIANIMKNVVLLLLIYAVSYMLAILLGSHFISAIKRIIDVASEIEKGNLAAKTNLTGSDEIAAIGKAMDQMAVKINQRISVVEEYNNLKSLFLATVSHELKTPLNIILGCIQLINKLNTNDPALYIVSINRYNKLMQQNSYRLLRLINNLIDINKIEAHSMQVKFMNGNIIKILEDITLSVVEYTKMKNLHLTFDTEVEEKNMAFDPDHIERIMLNILSNAIKFTQPGGMIEVCVFDREEKIAISIKDNGIGIPPEKQNTIFDRFTQVDNSFTRKSEGSGIGLSLVKSLVEMHEGKIMLQSEPGKGSEFIIELPVRTIHSEEAGDDRNDINMQKIHIEFSDIYM